MNNRYWNEINEPHIDDIIANRGDIRFIHDPRLPENQFNIVDELPTATAAQRSFKQKCIDESLSEIRTFMDMEYEYLLSKGYSLAEDGLMKK